MDLTKFGFMTSKKKKRLTIMMMKRKKRKNNIKQRERETSRKIGQTSSQMSGMQYHLTRRGTYMNQHRNCRKSCFARLGKPI